MIYKDSGTTQESCLVESLKPKDNKQEWGFISNYYDQYREVEFIFKKYWEILKMDRILRKVLPDIPPFIYRKNPSFGDSVVKKSVGSTYQTQDVLA